MRLVVLFCSALSILISVSVFADYRDALRVRDAIEIRDPRIKRAIAEKGVRTIKLPTTRGFDQADSQFCWVFSAMSMLETNYLARNPQVQPADVELSRWYFEQAVPSRYRRGTAADALYSFSPKIGLVAFSDYKSGPVDETVFRGELMAPVRLRKLMLGGEKYWTYAFSETIEGWEQHPDRDALAGTKAYYVLPEKKAQIVQRALAKGSSVEITIHGHTILIYGGIFDENGEALSYFIKDSYPRYFYEAGAGWAHSLILEMTTVSDLN